MRRLLLLGVVALAVAAPLAAAPAAAPALGAPGDRPERPGGPVVRAAGEDSPWPDTERLGPNVRAVRRIVTELEHKVELMEQSAARYADWQACLRGVPISEYGDQDSQFGYGYDDVDGTGPAFKSALAVDRISRPRREDYLFLAFSQQGNCVTGSDAPVPGGTADPASVVPRGPLAPPPATSNLAPPPRPAAPVGAAGGREARAETARRRPGRWHGARMRPRPPRGSPALDRTLTNLERRVRQLKRAEGRLMAASERFDEWESCVSWVPVTEYGDPDGMFGYLFGPRGTTAPRHRAAITIDRSDWDDPEYEFLAFVGGDRPGRTCQDEPGEAVD